MAIYVSVGSHVADATMSVVTSSVLAAFENGDKRQGDYTYRRPVKRYDPVRGLH